jgi:translation initiation factor IF-3
MSKKQRTKTKTKFEKTVNQQITRKYKRVNLVTDNGLQEMDSRRALNKAEEQELDLVLMSVKGDIPVCKIIDYKKYLYDAKKKEREAQKKANKTETKEIRLGLDTDSNDILTKSKQAIGFLSKGASVKISLRIRGGINMKRKHLGGEKIEEFFNQIASGYENKIEFSAKPKLQGRNWSAMIVNSKR